MKRTKLDAMVRRKNLGQHSAANGQSSWERHKQMWAPHLSQLPALCGNNPCTAPMHCMHSMLSEWPCTLPCAPHRMHPCQSSGRTCSHALPHRKDRWGPHLTTTTCPSFFSWSSHAGFGRSVRTDALNQVLLISYSFLFFYSFISRSSRNRDSSCIYAFTLVQILLYQAHQHFALLSGFDRGNCSHLFFVIKR
jgi:hypothetical protein